MSILLSFLLFSCDQIVFKRGDKVPYKIASGSYVVKVHKIDYPETKCQKESFLAVLEKDLSEIVISRKRYMIMLKESFMKDLLNIDKYGLLPEEMHLHKTASQLNKEEIERLIEDIGGNKDKKYKIQELLNFQVKELYRLLGNYVDFDDSKNYTELSKGEIISGLLKKRRRILSIIRGRHVDMVVEIDNLYSKEDRKDYEYLNNYYMKNIKTSRPKEFNDSYRDYKDVYIYFSNINQEDVDKILTSETKIDLKEYLLSDSRFSGYLLRGESIIYFVKGKDRERVNHNSSYKIEIEIVDIPVGKINEQKESLTLKDLYK